MHLNLLLGTEETAEGKKTYLDVYNPTCFVNKYYGTLNEYQVVSDSLQPMDCSTPHFSVLHHLLELVKLMSMSQWCHPTVLSSVAPFSSCPQSFPASGSQLLFQWVSSSHQVAKVSEFQLQYQSFQRIFRTDINKRPLIWKGPWPCSWWLFSH